MAILISDEVNFRGMKVLRDKDGHYMAIKGSVHQEDITSFKVCTTHENFKIYEAKLIV